jgi:hypothetical protein
MYECYDDYFIAYKAIRSDNYSLYNFQYNGIGNTYNVMKIILIILIHLDYLYGPKNKY